MTVIKQAHGKVNQALPPSSEVPDSRAQTRLQVMGQDV